MNQLFLQPKIAITIILLLFSIGIVSAGNVSANFTATPVSAAIPPLTVQFNDTSVCDPAPCTDWSWDFNGDGAIDSVLRNGTYIFTTSGNYSPSLFVSNDYFTDTERKLHYIHVGGTFGAPTITPAVTWGSPYHNTTDGTEFSFKMDTQVDLKNSTYLKYWLPNFTTTKKFDIGAFSQSLVAPLIAVFGFWIFLIIWMLYTLSVWIRTGDTTLPLVIGIISMPIFGVLFPKEALPVIIIMFVVCAAIVLSKVLKE